MILATSHERVGLLMAGYLGREIEALYVMLNFFEIVNVNWHDGAATKHPVTTLVPSVSFDPRYHKFPLLACVKAAPSPGGVRT